MNKMRLFNVIFLLMPLLSCLGASNLKGTVETLYLDSEILKENKINLDTHRMVKVYLPEGYKTAKKPYPVVYFLHNYYWSATQAFEDTRMLELLDQAISNGVTRPFILVAADYSTSKTGCLYGNSPVSGKWLDFTRNELVSFIDSHYRTLKNFESRALTGDFFGAYGALKLAMESPEIFGAVYAMHPVALGQGDLPWSGIGIDWEAIHKAQSWEDISGTNGRTPLFITLSQDYLPNLNRPPFYCDFFTEMKSGKLVFDIENTLKMQEGFLLDLKLNDHRENLKKLKGVAYDWARFDETRAHVESNRQFSRMLTDLGIEHEAEEYAGTPYDKNWISNGRFYARVLPFLNSHLIF
ncbi:alpha/beta hydrolase [Flavobacterium sp. RHBU_24]|uniref:alpha/beta hydrolase n=1 Tax=Flavobacterium sp. RHBU_24 TaxID=3391185 RepID=UPI0039851FA1